MAFVAARSGEMISLLMVGSPTGIDRVIADAPTAILIHGSGNCVAGASRPQSSRAFSQRHNETL